MAADQLTGRRIAVLDDDPTGSQTVHGVQVVTRADGDGIDAALSAPGSTCFVLTNSRSLPEAAAIELNADLGRSLLDLGQRLGGRLNIVSRSDSTLRGHFIAEVRAWTARGGTCWAPAMTASCSFPPTSRPGGSP